MSRAGKQLHEAVLFFEDGRPNREMLFPEFEAILDGIVPLTAFAEDEASAVYVQVDGQLHITAAVFFLISFDQKGYADKQWNIPLQQLASNAGKGPNLGAGPIRLACRSQCSIPWHQKHLWNPDMSPDGNSFVLLRKAIKQNRLDLPVAASEDDVDEDDLPVLTSAVDEQAEKKKALAALKSQLEQSFRDRMAQLLKEQRLRISTLNEQREEEIRKLQLAHQERLHNYHQQLTKLKEKFLHEQERNTQYKEQLEAQAARVEKQRRQFEKQLMEAKVGEGAQLESLKKNFELEVQAKVEAASAELKEMLQMREMELHYRNEQESNLRQEIARLRQEKQNLLSGGGDPMLERLEEAGVNFVVYIPGVGPSTIPREDAGRYLEDPKSYWADKSGVNQRLYQQWLEHYELPTCQALLPGGDTCGAPLERVEKPSQFLIGESDRCPIHRNDINTAAHRRASG